MTELQIKLNNAKVSRELKKIKDDILKSKGIISFYSGNTMTFETVKMNSEIPKDLQTSIKYNQNKIKKLELKLKETELKLIIG